MTHLHHVTLQTGHSRRSWRHEIPPNVMPQLHDILERSLSGRVQLPNTSGCELQSAGHGRCMVATVWHGDLALVTLGVAGRSRCGAALWRDLVASDRSTYGRLHGSPDRQPEVPWCAVRLEPGLAVMGDALDWLGDMERCIAWAWLDRSDNTG